eukprot:1541763-Rhodomonas_salina.3
MSLCKLSPGKRASSFSNIILGGSSATELGTRWVAAFVPPRGTFSPSFLALGLGTAAGFSFRSIRTSAEIMFDPHGMLLSVPLRVGWNRVQLELHLKPQSRQAGQSHTNPVPENQCWYPGTALCM